MKGSPRVNRKLPNSLKSTLKEFQSRVTQDFLAKIQKNSSLLRELFEATLLSVKQSVEVRVKERQKEFLSQLRALVQIGSPLALDFDLIQKTIAHNLNFLFLDGSKKSNLNLPSSQFDLFSGECWHSSKSLEGCLSSLSKEARDQTNYFEENYRISDETTENEWSRVLSKLLFDNVSYADSLKILAMEKFSAKFGTSLVPPRDSVDRPPNALYLALASTRNTINVPVLIWIPGVKLPLLFDRRSTESKTMTRSNKKIHPLHFTLTPDTNLKIGSYILSPLQHRSPSLYRIEYKKGEIGWTFKRMWGEMVKRAKVVILRDYTERHYQWHNLREFLEMLVEVNRNRNHPIDVMVLGTKAEIDKERGDTLKNQEAFFQGLKEDLKRSHDVNFHYSFDGNVHDRKIEVVYAQEEVNFHFFHFFFSFFFSLFFIFFHFFSSFVPF